MLLSNSQSWLSFVVNQTSLPSQGQEYAALGALVSDDEPLSSPHGATEMELKVKQVRTTNNLSPFCQSNLPDNRTLLFQ